ncbi:MAG TPA: DMT family transporter [Hyphomicrobiaceae bacterium]|nr:DMT family transporter [Hyphomicrobiaceae bacterium]
MTLPYSTSPDLARVPRLLAVLSLVASMSLTGANVPFGKAVMAEMPVEVFLVFRFAIASLALALLVRTEPGPLLRTMSPGQTVSLAMLGIVGSVLFTVFLLEGVKRTSGADAGIITATLPAVVALLGLFVLGQRLAASQFAMVALAVAGILIMQPASAAGGTRALIGNLLVGLAVLCEATFVLLSQRMSAIYRPIRLSLGVSVVSLLASVPFAATALLDFDWTSVSPGIWALATWYALSASALCTILWYRGAARVETWMAGLATAALPVSALAVSALFLGEEIGIVRMLGAAFVISAIALGALAPVKLEQGRS